MISRPNHIVDLLFYAIGLLAVESDLISALVKPPFALNYREVAVRRFVIKGGGLCVLRRRAMEGSRHASAAVSPPDIRMTTGASRRIHIGSAGGRRRDRMVGGQENRAR